MTKPSSIFIIEPNPELVQPYDIFSQLYPTGVDLVRYQTLNQAEDELRLREPALVVVSTKFAPMKTVKFLENFKNTFVDQLTPLIYVLDWSEKISRLVGTHWGNEIGLIHTLSSKEEVIATLKRLHPNLPAISESQLGLV